MKVSVGSRTKMPMLLTLKCWVLQGKPAGGL